MMNRPIALLTDFGLSGHYAGSIKSVILSINPKALIFDITHDVRPYNIREGAFILDAVFRFLPKGIIVVAVVDPGVGSERAALCIKAGDQYLLGPDNGLLSLALRNSPFVARKITNSRFFVKPVSPTFHGRDIFSPCAAWLSKKDVFSSLGPNLSKIRQINFPKPSEKAGKTQGEIVYIDRFGNAMTNIQKKGKRKQTIRAANRIVPIKPYFGVGKRGELIALWNSSDILELAVYNDSAGKKYGLEIGDKVEIF